MDDAANKIKSNFSIEQSKKTSTIMLIVNGDKPERCQEWLSAIIESYQIETQNEKRKRAKFTMDFIDDRLAYVGQDLDSVESNLENFKKQNDIQRVSAEAGLYLDKVKSGDKLAAETDLQLLVLGEIEKYVQGRIKKPGMVPSMIGLGDANLTSYFEKLNEADSMIFQTESQLKELGDKLSDEHKTAIEYALTELRMAHQSQDITAIQSGLDNINAAWKVATEAMYAQGEQAQGGGQQPQGEQPQGDNVEDVEFEEVK